MYDFIFKITLYLYRNKFQLKINIKISIDNFQKLKIFRKKKKEYNQKPFKTLLK